MPLVTTIARASPPRRCATARWKCSTATAALRSIVSAAPSTNARIFFCAFFESKDGSPSTVFTSW